MRTRTRDVRPQSESTGAMHVRLVSADEYAVLVPRLVELLSDIVDGGASLGFLPPVVPDEARAYWSSLLPEIRAGRRVFIGAFDGECLVGAGQLLLSPLPNAQHRAELQKLFVARSARGQGVARALMEALHSAGRERGRSLILLHTRRGGIAEQLYRGLGYREVGIVPGYTMGPDGRPIDSVSLYVEL